jgi:phage-related minor tail protein
LAGNIKGITVDIGGNTGPLDKALKGVNQTSRDLQSELKQVEKLLKLDPTNTELLSQKQKLLTDAVGNTKEKLDTLKEAEKQVQEQFKEGKISEEQYRAFQRELIKTEGELKKTEEAAKKTGDGFDYLGTKSEKMNDFMKKAGETVGAAAIAAGAASIKMAIDFDDSMAKISTVSDESEVPLNKLKKQIIELSNQTGISATDIANNVYDAISAGHGSVPMAVR